MDSLKDWLMMAVLCVLCSACVSLATKDEPVSSGVTYVRR